MADAAGFPSRYDKILKQLLHPSGVVVLTPEGVVSSYLLGIGYTATNMRAAVIQARRRVVAPPDPTPILLMSFQYDSTTVRYILVIMKVLRLFAAVTLIATVGIVVYLRRSERRA